MLRQHFVFLAAPPILHDVRQRFCFIHTLMDLHDRNKFTFDVFLMLENLVYGVSQWCNSRTILHNQNFRIVFQYKKKPLPIIIHMKEGQFHPTFHPQNSSSFFIPLFIHNTHYHFYKTCLVCIIILFLLSLVTTCATSGKLEYRFCY